jgi:hypothetical protein
MASSGSRLDQIAAFWRRNWKQPLAKLTNFGLDFAEMARYYKEKVC